MSYFEIQANIWIQNDFLWQFFLFNFEDNHFKEFHILKRVNDIVFWNQIWSVFQAVLYLEIYLVLQMSWVYHWNWTFPLKPDTASQGARRGCPMLMMGPFSYCLSLWRAWQQKSWYSSSLFVWPREAVSKWLCNTGYRVLFGDCLH